MYSTFRFDHYIARDNEVIKLTVKATVQPREPDVGITSEYVEDVTVTDKDGRPAQITEDEYAEIMAAAEEQLAESQASHYNIDDALDF